MLFSAGKISITPLSKYPLAGFPGRNGVFNDVSDELEINLLVFRNNDKLTLIYSVDAFLVPYNFIHDVYRQYKDSHNVELQDIVIAASHTHFSPVLDVTKPMLGEANAEYIDYVRQKLLELTNETLSSGFRHVKIEIAETEQDLNVNRRKRLLRYQDGRLRYKTLMYPDYNGTVDKSVKLIKIIGDDGEVVAILWSYACHPVHYPKRDSVSADYIGHVRSTIRRLYNRDTLPVCFLQGFSGNVRAKVASVTHTEAIDKLLYAFQLPPLNKQFKAEADYDKWVSLLEDKIVSILNTLGKQIDCEVVNKAISIHKLDNFFIEGTNKNLVIQKISFAPQVSIIAVSAEVSAEYAKALQAADSDMFLLTCGCTAGTNIYIPTNAMIKDGGYEVEGFKKLFNVNGKFAPNIEQRFLQECYSILKDNGEA